MPSNFLNADIAFPQLDEGQSAQEQIERVMNYLYMVLEQLRYTLANLGEENFNETELSSLTKTITEPIYAQLEDEAGNVASLQATANRLSSEMFDSTGKVSLVEQSVSAIRLSASNGSDGKSSTITISSDGVFTDSDTISFDGLVSFANLSSENGTTTINGGNITTGTIKANMVDISGRFSLYNGNTQYGYMGCGYGSDGENGTYGAMLVGSDSGYYFIATDGGVRMTANNDQSLYCTGNGIYASEEISQPSDRRLKQDIDADLRRYEGFYRALRPCRFRLVKGKSGRYHTGFIAQEVEEALEAGGLDTSDLAALVKNPKAVGHDEADPEYGLRYDGFIALNTYMIQQLERRVAALEEQVRQRQAAGITDNCLEGTGPAGAAGQSDGAETKKGGNGE